jgi:rod shape-determining protein MreC
VYLDKGSHDGIKPDMAVITADGVVGKVLRVYGKTSQVLLINDQTSGVGSILEKSRLQGVMRGTPAGEVVMEKVMEGEAVQPGEQVLTSGGDQIFPKGLPVGTVTKVSKGSELFLNIKVKPAADLSRLEEVLVITQQEEREPVVSDEGRLRAADILAQRLPSVPEKPAGQSNVPPPTSGLKITPAPNAAGQPTAAKPNATGTSAQGATPKPPVSNATSKPSVNPDPSAGTKPAAAGSGTNAAPANKPAKPKALPANPPATAPESNPSPSPQDQPQ